MSFKGFTTRIVHHDRLCQLESGAVHAPVFNSVLYGYDDAQGLVDVFQGRANGHAYARQSTPTMSMLQSLVTELEGGRGTLVFGTGMAAITAVFLALLKSGDHVIASRFLFGNTHSLFGTLANFGIEITLLDPTEVANVEAAIQPNTRMVFVESLANPGTQIPDFEGISAVCHDKHLLFVIDNTLTTSYLMRPKDVGAHLSVMSLTKYFCGHGNVLAGSVTDTGLFDWSNYPHIFPAYRKGDPAQWGLTQIKKKALRDMGASLSSESAAQISIGAETMALRMDRACENAAALAKVLQDLPQIEKVYHPSLPDHPQHARAEKLFKHFGGLLSFDLKESIDPVSFLNSVEISINATHLGDNRTLALPVAKTIYHEMGPENRRAQNIKEGMIRCSVGIEDTQDLIDSFKAAATKF